jgi:hypothetical protein
VPGNLQIIEYECDVEPQRLAALHVSPMETARVGPEIGILRCVASDGHKLTCVCKADQIRTLVDTSLAGESLRANLVAENFPIVRPGWPGRF